MVGMAAMGLWWAWGCGVVLSRGGCVTVVGLGRRGLWDMGCVGLGYGGSLGGGVLSVWW